MDDISEMGERIARALFSKRFDPGSYDSPYLAIARNLCVRDAILAIETLREPTEEMMKAGLKRLLMGYNLSSGGPPQPPREVWRDMIDAALRKDAHG